jgi:ankyrin repeat protein
MLAGYLMGKSAQIYLTDREGDTALHWAAFKGTCIELAAMLQ